MIRAEPMTPTWLRVTASSPAEHAFLQGLPGAQRSKGQWLVPADLGDTIGASPLPAPEVAGLNPKLHEYQRQGVFKLLHQGSLIIAFEMRMGKSATFIEACRLRYEQHQLGPRPIPALVVCPAIARYVWADQFDQWWPKHPGIVVIESSEQLKKLFASQGEHWDIMVTSYELMMRNIDALAAIRWNAVCFDEVHRVKNTKTMIAGAAARITMNKPQALKVAMSATPIDNEPRDLYNLLTVLRPGALGTEKGFNNRYSLFEINEAGYRTPPKGLNPEHAEELASRIRYFSARATKREFAHLFPPLNPQIIRIKPDKRPDWRQVFDKWSGEKNLHDTTLDSYFQKAGSLKVEPAVELALEARKSRSHVLVATFFHETAHQITKKLEAAGETVVEITGKMTAGKRKPALEKAAKLKNAVIVVSMRSVSEALEISFCSALIIAELSHVPKDLEQLSGRVHSMHSKGPVDIFIIVVRGTYDEVIAKRLDRKMDDINQLIGNGMSAAAIHSALAQRTPSKKEIMDELFAAASSRVEVDPYA